MPETDDPPRTNGEQLRFVREIQKRRTGLRVTQRAAAAILGIDEELYRAIEYDRRQLRPEEARKLAAAWHCAPEDLYATEAVAPTPRSRRPKEVTTPRPGTPMGKVEVPFVGPVKAGPWHSPLESSEEEPIDVDMYAPNVFTSYLIGDSMEDFLKEADQLVFKSTENERVLPRDVVIARNSENDITVKQYMMDGVLPYLHPLNPKYEDIYGVDGEWTVFGILTGYVREEDGDKIKRHNASRLRPK